MRRCSRVALAACIVLMQLCGACAPAVRPEPTVVRLYPARCARPAKPDLPKLSGLAWLESRAGYARLAARDAAMRRYVAALEGAVDCYEAQLPEEGGE